MMMHPIRPDQLPENVVEYLQASLNAGLFEITPEKFCSNISRYYNKILPYLGITHDGYLLKCLEAL